MGETEIKALIAAAFVHGGQWSEQWKAWNDEKSSSDFRTALNQRGSVYATDVLEKINEK